MAYDHGINNRNIAGNTYNYKFNQIKYECNCDSFSELIVFAWPGLGRTIAFRVVPSSGNCGYIANPFPQQSD